MFEIANQGTLFLDEIGDLDPRMQVKLLRVLDGASYYRVGGVKKVIVDVRVVAATNQDLKAGGSGGAFPFRPLSPAFANPDLCSSLRESRDDIVPLALHYLAQENPVLSFPQVAGEVVRSRLAGECARIAQRGDAGGGVRAGPEITLADLPEAFTQSSFSAGLQRFAALPDMERRAILAALEETRGHQQRAADKLGFPSEPCNAR